MMMENCGITPVYNVDGNNNNGAWGDGGWLGVEAGTMAGEVPE